MRNGVAAAVARIGVLLAALGGVTAGAHGQARQPEGTERADAPTVALFVARPHLGRAPLKVAFDASRSTAGAEYAWDFGDGATGNGVRAEHVYTQPGTYRAALRVRVAGRAQVLEEFEIVVADGSFDVHGPVTPDEARRFLWQAAFGPRDGDVEYIVENGYEAWIDQQLATTPTLMQTQYLSQSIALGYGYGADTIWDDVCVEAPDQLRQRMAWALLQVLVMNDPQDSASADMIYYSSYIAQALGNYRALLGTVARSHQMGVFLTYINNQRANPATGAVPDENFARELLQLFSIGLWKLNPDGTRVLDQGGAPVPTYNNETVKQFARVFTGLGWNSDYSGPMRMNAGSHEFGAKQLLIYPGAVPANGFIPAITVPAQQTAAAAQADIDRALDNVFFHPNCAPFIADLLIKRLVTSNPTPAYVGRVAAAFSGNGPYGSGVRGDLFATAKAILLDPEARDPAYRASPYAGKAAEPMVVRWALYRALGRVNRPNEAFPFRINSDSYELQLDTGQSFMGSPSVFNFYLPDYIPPRTRIADAGLYAPEFQILNDYTSLATHERFHSEFITPGGAQEPAAYAVWSALAPFPALLVAELNSALMYGRMSEESAEIIEGAVAAVGDTPSRVRTAVWLVINSPEFRVLR